MAFYDCQNSKNISETARPPVHSNNLMDLAQPSGYAFCYFQLKLGKKYVTMEMAKGSRSVVACQEPFS